MLSSLKFHINKNNNTQNTPVTTPVTTLHLKSPFTPN